MHGQLARWRRWSTFNVGEATEGLDYKLWRKWSNGRVALLILQHFRRFTYVTAHSPTLPLLHLCHSSFSNPSVASPTSPTPSSLHLRQLASRPRRLSGSQIFWSGIPFALRNNHGYYNQFYLGLNEYYEYYTFNIDNRFTVRLRPILITFIAMSF